MELTLDDVNKIHEYYPYRLDMEYRRKRSVIKKSYKYNESHEIISAELIYDIVQDDMVINRKFYSLTKNMNKFDKVTSSHHMQSIKNFLKKEIDYTYKDGKIDTIIQYDLICGVFNKASQTVFSYNLKNEINEIVITDYKTPALRPEFPAIKTIHRLEIEYDNLGNKREKFIQIQNGTTSIYKLKSTKLTEKVKDIYGNNYISFEYNEETETPTKSEIKPIVKSNMVIVPPDNTAYVYSLNLNNSNIIETYPVLEESSTNIMTVILSKFYEIPYTIIPSETGILKLSIQER